MQNPEVHEVLSRFGTDVSGLISLADVLFEERDFDRVSTGVPSKKLSFSEFLNVILRLRGGHSARVTDIVDLREYVRHRLDRLELQLPKRVNPAPEVEPPWNLFMEQLAQIRAGQQSLSDEVMEIRRQLVAVQAVLGSRNEQNPVVQLMRDLIGERGESMPPDELMAELRPRIALIKDLLKELEANRPEEPEVTTLPGSVP